MRIRSFVAINFSMAVTRRVAEEVERHKAKVGSAHVAWVPPANYHVTLFFLGSVEEELLDGVTGRLRERARTLAPFEVRARGMGAFPAGTHPRVLWVGVDGGEPLLALAREVEAVMVGLGLPKPGPEERAFHPHLTIGRVKSGGGFEWSAEAELGMSQAHEMVVYESKMTSKGSEYIARARIPLGKGV